MFKRSITLALLAGATLLAGAAAQAGEVGLFTGHDFEGREMRFRSAVPDLNQIGFDNRGNSLRVHSGRWQVCEHPNFRGQCVYLDRGEYPDLRRLGNRISSLREVGDRRGRWDDERRYGWEQGRDRYDDGYERDDRYDRYDDRYDRRDDHDGRLYRDDSRRGPAIELYRKAEFHSDRRDLNDSVLRDFGVIGFHDRTQSMVIRYGQWEFCEHPDFRGRCEVYGPGRYAHLGHMSSVFSSMRRVR